MDEKRTDGAPASPQSSDWAKPYLAEPKPPFSASRTEVLAAWLMYALAFLYACWLFSGSAAVWWMTAFTVGYVLLTELLHRGTPRPKESWLWLGCVALLLLSLIRTTLVYEAANRAGVEPPEQALQTGYRYLALHLLAVYWAMCRSGRLTGGESGQLLPLDALYAFLLIPFGHLFLRVRCVVAGLKPKKPRACNAGAIAAGVLAAFAVLVLLSLAATQLSAADDGFGQLLSALRQALSFELDGRVMLRVIISLPVGAYLFGLLAGLRRQEPAQLRRRSETVLGVMRKLRTVPDFVWSIALGLFSGLYLVFFFVQGRYLFGAFTRTLPESFTVAEYARQGFFELCRVMAINFTLFWLVTRTARAAKSPAADRLLRSLCAALLIESMLFALIALSKLGLYISCFGFTPRRLQSTWLVLVLLAGCVCALYTHLRGKKSMRVWMAFGAITLSLLACC